MSGAPIPVDPWLNLLPPPEPTTALPPAPDGVGAHSQTRLSVSPTPWLIKTLLLSLALSRSITSCRMQLTAGRRTSLPRSAITVLRACSNRGWCRIVMVSRASPLARFARTYVAWTTTAWGEAELCRTSAIESKREEEVADTVVCSGSGDDRGQSSRKTREIPGSVSAIFLMI